MSQAVLALVGRPNVGKSTLFNRLAKKKLAIVENMPGVTRDRHYAEIMLNETPLLLVDTGGFEPKNGDDMLMAMRKQTELAIEEAHAVILVTDAAAGLRPEDKEIARRLRKAQKPFIVCVNKIDHETHDLKLHEFHQLGAKIFAVSAEHARGIPELSAAVLAIMPKQEAPEPAPNVAAHLAVVGRPNAGKSSLINRLLGDERHLATPIAGTTRDSIDSIVAHEGQRFCFIDTAGLRRKSRIAERLEEFMVVSAIRSLERANVVVLLLDAQEIGAEQDAKIAALAHARGKGIVIAVNKWDLPRERITAKNLREEVDRHFPFLSYAPLVFMSAKTGQGIDELWAALKHTLAQCERRVSTGELNRMLPQLLEQHLPPSISGKRGKMYFGSQVSVSPPTFVLHVNDPNRFDESYARYITNALRKTYGFAGTPIVIRFRRRHKEEQVLENGERVKDSTKRPRSQKGQSKKRPATHGAQKTSGRGTRQAAKAKTKTIRDRKGRK